MIVAERGSELLLVTQPDHAHLSGELLGLWREDGLPAHPRRAELLFAGREHDNGWREEDAAPRWDAGSGRPHDFLSLPRLARIAVWERGTARFAASHPYAALLVVLHARGLHPERSGDWEGFHLTLDALESRLLEAAGASPSAAGEVAADYRFVELADLISLSALADTHERFSRHGMTGRRDGETVLLDPFPLAGATAFAVPCRRIPRRAYAGDADLGGELAAARWETVRVRLAPG